MGVLRWRRHWLVPQLFLCFGLLSTTPCLGGCGKTGRVGGWGGQGILLGPEATSPCFGVWGFGVWQSRAAYQTSSVCEGFPVRGACSGWVLVVGVGVGGCALFENYTVDASIFVVKLLRADGGCLGTRSR